MALTHTHTSCSHLHPDAAVQVMHMSIFRSGSDLRLMSLITSFHLFLCCNTYEQIPRTCFFSYNCSLSLATTINLFLHCPPSTGRPSEAWSDGCATRVAGRRIDFLWADSCATVAALDGRRKGAMEAVGCPGQWDNRNTPRRHGALARAPAVRLRPEGARHHCCFICSFALCFSPETKLLPDQHFSPTWSEWFSEAALCVKTFYYSFYNILNC